MSEDLIPLMSEDEAELLTTLVQQMSEDGCILEYGCGGSSLLFQSLLGPKQGLYSVEHNLEWFDRIAPRFTKAGCTIFYISGVQSSYAMPSEELPAQVYGYICPPSIPWSRVQLVFVDGIARGACLATALCLCQPGTKVVLHDYVGRQSWYDWAVKLYPAGAITNTMIELTVPPAGTRQIPDHTYTVKSAHDVKEIRDEILTLEN